MANNKSIMAAGDAIDSYATTMGIERPSTPGILLYHMLFGLLDWCDANEIDFDAEVSCVRAEFQAEREG